MHSKELTKPDGRRLTLYSNRPIPDGIDAPSPFPDPLQANPHLRWHPLRGEWVTYAGFRQNRTFLPPPEYNPLAVTTDPAFPTEMPQGDYEVAVFDNRFPSLALESHDPPHLTVPTAPANGHCEVVVFTQDPKAALVHLPLSRIELLFQVWGDRTRRIGGTHHIQYVLPFENRGAEVGVTLHHPHGQIYAYPFVPPVPRRILKRETAHFRRHGRNLLVELMQQESESGRRVIWSGDRALAFVPAWARYPFEVWLAPRQPCASFCALEREARDELALALRTVLRKYDRLFERPMPYVLAWYQAPVRGRAYPECQLHAEILPAYRTSDKLKYLAGTEVAAGMFANDMLPEEAAARLAAVVA
jgi:UDPglucose--hexose-1-phosphate uridylyltransferase